MTLLINTQQQTPGLAPQQQQQQQSGTAASSGSSSSEGVKEAAVWSACLQQLLEEVCSFLAVRQAMMPQVVYLGLNGKLQQICRWVYS